MKPATLTVKLDKDVERELELHCRRRRVTKSEVVLKLIQTYLQAQAQRSSPYELAEKLNLVGAQRTARAAARDHARYLKEKLRARGPGRHRAARICWRSSSAPRRK